MAGAAGGGGGQRARGRGAHPPATASGHRRAEPLGARPPSLPLRRGEQRQRGQAGQAQIRRAADGGSTRQLSIRAPLPSRPSSCPPSARARAVPRLRRRRGRPAAGRRPASSHFLPPPSGFSLKYAPQACRILVSEAIRIRFFWIRLKTYPGRIQGVSVSDTYRIRDTPPPRHIHVS